MLGRQLFVHSLAAPYVWFTRVKCVRTLQDGVIGTPSLPDSFGRLRQESRTLRADSCQGSTPYGATLSPGGERRRSCLKLPSTQHHLKLWITSTIPRGVPSRLICQPATKSSSPPNAASFLTEKESRTSTVRRYGHRMESVGNHDEHGREANSFPLNWPAFASVFACRLRRAIFTKLRLVKIGGGGRIRTAE